jgi:hypothetical protein
MIENTLRHIHYSDHPIEFQMLMLDEEHMPFRVAIFKKASGTVQGDSGSCVLRRS